MSQFNGARAMRIAYAFKYACAKPFALLPMGAASGGRDCGEWSRGRRPLNSQNAKDNFDHEDDGGGGFVVVLAPSFINYLCILHGEQKNFVFAAETIV